MVEPLPICYLNGEFQKLRDARVSPLDRAFLFGDSVYEVLPVFDGRMFRFRQHFDRLAGASEAVVRGVAELEREGVDDVLAG